MEAKLLELIRQLDESNPVPVPSPQGVPDYLWPKYFRESLMRDLRPHVKVNALIRAALWRTAILDSEEDVRQAAINELFIAHVDGLETLLAAAAFDREDAIRLLALEGLNYLDSPARFEVATFLSSDSEPDVAKLAEDILAGRQILYYELSISKLQ